MIIHLRKYFSTYFILIFLIFGAKFAFAERPFRLLTMEAAANPSATVVAGLQEIGYVAGPVFIDVNPLLMAANTANLGGKFVFNVAPDFQLTVGARYFQLLGSAALETRVKQSSAFISKFQLKYSGFTSYVGATYTGGPANLHFNLQTADISGSKILGAVLGTSIVFGDVWSLIAEGGYEFTKKHPRASLGIARHGPVFGFKFGATYVELNDPLLNYKGPIPVLDFYWLFGGAKGGKK